MIIYIAGVISWLVVVQLKVYSDCINFACQSLCPFGAIDFNEWKNVVVVNAALCKGCGTYVAACPSGAMVQNHFANFQLNSIINAALKPSSVSSGGK